MNPKLHIGLLVAALVMLAQNAWAMDTVPDGGSTSLLLVLALAGLGVLRRFLPRWRI
jgi:hypothetical protein